MLEIVEGRCVRDGMQFISGARSIAGAILIGGPTMAHVVPNRIIHTADRLRLSSDFLRKQRRPNQTCAEFG
jgi:hypothetical protein